MLEFEALKVFINKINVPLLLKHHWNDSTKWVMAKFMHKQIIKRVK
jgi:hypothetical protein